MILQKVNYLKASNKTNWVRIEPSLCLFSDVFFILFFFSFILQLSRNHSLKQWIVSFIIILCDIFWQKKMINLIGKTVIIILSRLHTFFYYLRTLHSLSENDASSYICTNTACILFSNIANWYCIYKYLNGGNPLFIHLFVFIFE